MPELLPDEQVRLLAAARNPDGSRRFYPAGLHPATHRLREHWRLLDALPESPERDEALAYVERELAMFEAGETEAKRRYLAASGERPRTSPRSRRRSSGGLSARRGWA